MAETLDWGPDGLPTSGSILAASEGALRQWVALRIRGNDGHWTPRAGDEPEDLIRALLSRPQDEAWETLASALCDVLEDTLERAIDDTDVRVVLSLVAELRRTPAREVTMRSWSILDRWLERRAAAALPSTVRAVLFCRAAFNRPVERRLWSAFTAEPDTAVAAFQCAAVTSVEDAAGALRDLLRIRNDPEDLPVLVFQVRLLQQVQGTPAARGLLERLMSDPEIGETACTLATAAGFWRASSRQPSSVDYAPETLEAMGVSFLIRARQGNGQRESLKLHVRTTPLVANWSATTY